MDFSLSKESKISAMNESLEAHENALYRLLVGLFIEPESFDPETWDTPLNLETPEGRVGHYIATIKMIKEKLAALEIE